jgi:hypothetical protein
MESDDQKAIRKMLQLERSSKIIKNGIEIWILPNGEYHRELGPAIIHPNGTKEWYQDGLRHNPKGPAVIKGIREEFWVNGDMFTRDEFIQWIEDDYSKE